VDVPVSAALTLSGSYAYSKGDIYNQNFGTSDSTASTALAVTSDSSDVKRTGWGIGANYALSKRTSIYGGYMATKEEANAAVSTGTSDAEVKVFAVGVRHTF